MTVHPLESYSAYLDGRSLSDAEVEALREWIISDERNAAEFVEFAILHAAITDRLMLGRLLDDLVSSRGASITPAMLTEAIREIEVNSPRVTLPPPPAPLPQRTPLSDILTPIAAAITVLCLGAWALWRGGGVAPPVAVAPQPKVGGPAVVAAQPEPTRIVARLSTSFDAQWADAADAVRPGDALPEGARLSLVSGVVQLDMAGGAEVVVEGPTELRLTAEDALRLNEGKAAVRIEGDAESFIVATPTMQVVDLGTEFGVETAASGQSQVMVFDGSVALAEASARATGFDAANVGRLAQRIEAGFQVRIDAAGDAMEAPEPLVNPRHFLRPDEVEVRLRALAGSLADRKLAAHFARQRIAGLLAYQGFDASTSATELVFGLAPQPLQATGQMRLIDGGDSSGLEVSGGPAFMQLDTTADGPFGRAELLTPGGRIGRSGTELWLLWRMQRLTGEVDLDNPGSAGLSLMFGERSDLDEPVFFGRAYGNRPEYCVQSAWGHGPPPEGERINVDVDADRQAPGLQARAVDGREHTWIVRIEFRDGADRVSVWFDAEPAALETAAPPSILDQAEVEFDRIRMAVNRGAEIWRFGEFAAALDLQALAELKQATAFRAD